MTQAIRALESELIQVTQAIRLTESVLGKAQEKHSEQALGSLQASKI